MIGTFLIYRESALYFNLDHGSLGLMFGIFTPRVLTDDRKPLGYIDVVALKKKFEAGEANPVCPSSLLL